MTSPAPRPPEETDKELRARWRELYAKICAAPSKENAEPLIAMQDEIGEILETRARRRIRESGESTVSIEQMIALGTDDRTPKHRRVAASPLPSEPPQNEVWPCDCEGLWLDLDLPMGDEARESYNRTGHLPGCLKSRAPLPSEPPAIAPTPKALDEAIGRMLRSEMTLGDAATILNALASLSSQLELARKPFLCNVCGGSGKPTSGLPCICGGVGTEQAELEGFRAQCYDLERSLERLKAENEQLKRDVDGLEITLDDIRADMLLTPEEARLALQCMPWQAPDDRFPGESELLIKLRRLSQSDTGDTNG